MPELPEVETLCRQLAPQVRGQNIEKIHVYEPRLRFPLASNFGSFLEDQTIFSVKRKGKYILFHLQSGRIWLVHLGMSGRLLWTGLNPKYFTHVSWSAKLQNGKEFMYCDPRRFGFSLLFEPNEAYLTDLGIEPLSKEFHRGYLHNKIRNRTRDIKNILMDQKIIAGIGNIYANEILFQANVHPLTPGRVLQIEHCEKIVLATKKILRQAIAFQGTSISDFLDTNGKQGRFQKRFAVYARNGKTCPICDCTIQKDSHSQRSFFYCPECQKITVPQNPKKKRNANEKSK